MENKRFIIDVNIALDILLDRTDVSPNIYLLYKKLRTYATLFLSTSQLHNIRFIFFREAKKSRKIQDIQQEWSLFLNLFSFAKTPSYLDRTHSLFQLDIEDYLIEASAKSIDAKIITRDQDFLARSPWTISIEAFLALPEPFASAEPIPFLDLKAINQPYHSGFEEGFDRVVNSGWYILGAEVEAFEKEWAEYCQANYAVGVANGLDALILALKALDIGTGDEVIVPSNTYIATWLAVSAVGAKPVAVEPNPTTYNIDPLKIEAAITANTRAILPVHLYGQPADLDPILAIAHGHGLFVVEDAAQAHGARYKGQRLGGHGDVVCWSFYPGKNLGAIGDAGAITTNHADLADRIRVLRNYGSKQKYVNEELGMNARLDPIQAAVLRVKLKHLDAANAHRRALAAAYSEGLKNSGLVLPDVPDWVEAVWHLYVVRSKNRDELQQRLKEAGIGTLIHYPIAPHQQKAYASLNLANNQLPIACDLASSVLSLPMGAHLGVPQVADIVAVMKSFA